MSNDEATLSSSSETMSTGGRYPDQKKRGKKRQRDSQQSSSSESGTSASAEAAKDLTETKSGSRPGTPNKAGDSSPDGAVKACPETGNEFCTKDRNSPVKFENLGCLDNR